MGDTVEKEVKVIGADFTAEAKSFLLLVECEEGKFYTQVRMEDLLPAVPNLDAFSQEDLEKCSEVFCENIMGKSIKVVFDPSMQSRRG